VTEADVEALVDLPITPLGLAGIYVGEEVDAVVARIGEPLVRRPASDAPREDSEFLEFGPFVVVGYRGIVDAVWALEGYRGRTLGGVGIGMPWTELLRRFPDVAFDEYRNAWRVPGWPHLGIEVSRPSRDDEAESDGPWTEEWHEITDPANAFISLIEVTLGDTPPANGDGAAD